MITFTNIRNAKPTEYEEIWAVVRSLKNQGQMIHVPALSPSWNLFKTYINLRNGGKWNADTFQTIYVPTFLREMKTPNAQAALNELITAGHTKNIAAVCFCTDQTLCHTSILAGILQYKGIEIKGAWQDYSGFGKLFETM